VPAPVIETKLRKPALPQHVVARAAFDAALDASPARLVIVHAKAGAGKTTALARWAQRHREFHVAWCSLDRADNDPDRFWAHVLAAIDRDIGVDALDFLEQGYAPDAVATAIVTDLERLAEPVTVVIDDVHVIIDPFVLDTLDAVVRYAPPAVRVVLAGREYPRLPAVEALRVRGELLEIDDTTLRMSCEEAQGALEHVVGAPLPATAVATLVDRTEGWAAGIALAGLTLRDSDDPVEAIRHFSGSDRPVAEYLTHEVLEHQPRHLVQFLLDTSVLERLDPDACAAITGRDDASAMLHDIERRSLFVTPTNDGPGTYGYDQLFRELLQAALRHADAARYRTLHLRAAAWYEEHGDTAAVEHWIEAGEVDRAWELFHGHAVARVFDGGRATVARWTTLLPDRTAAIDTARAVDLALALLYVGDTTSAQWWLERAAAVLAEADDVPDETRGRLAFAQYISAFARCDLATARDDADRALAILERAAPGMWGQLRGSVVYVRVASMLGDLDTADAMYRRAARELSARTPLDNVVLPTARCELELNRGRLSSADALARQAIEAAARIANEQDPITADARFVLGTVLLERNDVTGAEHELRVAMRLGELSGYLHSSACPALSLARAWHLLGRGAAAWALLEEIRQHRGRAVPYVLTKRIEAVSARLALLDGDLAGARAYAALCEEPWRSRMLARTHAAAGEHELACAAIEHVPTQRAWDHIDVLLVRARCASSQDERTEALRAALTIAEPDGYVRVFADEADWIFEPLRELVGVWPTSYVADLVTAIANEPTRRPPAPTTSALSDREIEVWRYLGTPLSTTEIADALFISRNTLKSHLRSIYRKLGVRNRHDAVARGQVQVQSPRSG
jgi:LuxR family maltose regulon positive regulatory protein